MNYDKGKQTLTCTAGDSISNAASTMGGLTWESNKVITLHLPNGLILTSSLGDSEITIVANKALWERYITEAMQNRRGDYANDLKKIITENERLLSLVTTVEDLITWIANMHNQFMDYNGDEKSKILAFFDLNRCGQIKFFKELCGENYVNNPENSFVNTFGFTYEESIKRFFTEWVYKFFWLHNFDKLTQGIADINEKKTIGPFKKDRHIDFAPRVQFQSCEEAITTLQNVDIMADHVELSSDGRLLMISSNTGLKNLGVFSSSLTKLQNVAKITFSSSTGLVRCIEAQEGLFLEGLQQLINMEGISKVSNIGSIKISTNYWEISTRRCIHDHEQVHLQGLDNLIPSLGNIPIQCIKLGVKEDKLIVLKFVNYVMPLANPGNILQMFAKHLCLVEESNSLIYGFNFEETQYYFKATINGIPVEIILPATLHLKEEYLSSHGTPYPNAYLRTLISKKLEIAGALLFREWEVWEGICSAEGVPNADQRAYSKKKLTLTTGEELPKNTTILDMQIYEDLQIAEKLTIACLRSKS